jgi:hypothetical protein
MEAKGWEGARGAPVRDWRAKARVLLAIWRDEKGGAAIEAKAGKAAAARAAARAAAAAAAEDARARLERVEALAAREDWEGVKQEDAAWRAANGTTFADYIAKRPSEWSRKITALPSGKPWKPGTPPRR